MPDNFQFQLAKSVLKYLSFFISIILYQSGIALMAKKRGDRSLETEKMASFNPIHHTEPIGTVLIPLMMIIANSPIVIGWPKFFQIDSRYFKKPRTDINIVYLTGVFTSILFAIICALVLRYLGPGMYQLSPELDFSNNLIFSKIILFFFGFQSMIMSSFFLLPIPGTATWNLLLNNLSYKNSLFLNEHSFKISIIGLLIIVSGIINGYFNFFAKIFILLSQNFVM